MAIELNVLNLDTATYECIYGRGCDGICCQNGRPPVPASEAAIIAEALPEALPLMTPEARALVTNLGFLSGRRKGGDPMLRVLDKWCVFFNQGCVLHKVGAVRGDAYGIKPSACALFPLEQTAKGEWYVRQWGLKGEQWDLFCLNPQQSPKPARESLAEEIALAAKFAQATESEKAA